MKVSRRILELRKGVDLSSSSTTRPVELGDRVMVCLEGAAVFAEEEPQPDGTVHRTVSIDPDRVLAVIIVNERARLELVGLGDVDQTA